MNFSSQQDWALMQARKWLDEKKSPVFMLGGFAGTGKTTLAKHLVSEVKGKVIFAAYTGKAAHVLRRSGVGDVSTIHKLIYLPKEKCQRKLKELEGELARLKAIVPIPEVAVARIDAAIAQEKRNLARLTWTLNTDSELQKASLLVIDEYSMVDQQMGEDLLSFNVPILALGDPGQLPPVMGRSFFARKPDCMLTQIHRQAEDNPIIRLSREVREGRPLRPGSYGDSLVVPYAQVSQAELQQHILQADQLLVGKNATRTSSNKRIRELLGRKDMMPEVGDKLVCLRNNHKLGIMNGQLFTVSGHTVGDSSDYILLDLTNEDKERVVCPAHPNFFLGTADKLDYWARKDAEEFDYGYALTTHRAQGSQWDKIVVFDEWFGSNRDQWLYTAITRAAKSVVVVQM